MERHRTSTMDAEYIAMRRRMSRLRVQCVQGPSVNAEDPGNNEGEFKDLIKFWKKHGIPIPKDLISDMADENVKRAKARGQGRRRSKELEDLHLCASTGKFNLENLNLDRLEENEDDTDSKSSEVKTVQSTKKPMIRRQTDTLLNKTRGSLKKQGSKSSLSSSNDSSPSTPRKFNRTLSQNK